MYSANAAIITNGVVTNIVVVDPDDLPDIDGLHVIDGGGVAIGWAFADGVFSPPVVQIDEIRSVRLTALRSDCAAAITGGFASSALGAPHTYPSTSTDQTNLMGSVVGSLLSGLPQDWTTPFWCRDTEGVWGFTPHTAGQIQQVGADGKAHVVDCQTRLGVLTAMLQAAETAADVEAVVWE